MDIVLDFETYYDSASKYSLSSMTTEEYIRHTEFEPIMLGVMIPSENECFWVPNYKGAIEKELDSLELHKHRIIAHNNRFDAGIIGLHYGIECAEYACTLAMARPLHGTKDSNSLAALAKRYGLKNKGTEVVAANGKRLRDFTKAELNAYGEYCLGDVEICWDLFEIFREHYTKQDLAIISDTLRCYAVPMFKVDVPLLEEYIPELEKRQAKLLRQAARLAGFKSVDEMAAVLRSNQKFAELLTSLGVEPPLKDSKTAKDESGRPKKTFAFSKNDLAFRELVESEDPLISAVCQARMGEKSTINRTRAERFIAIGNRGLLPVPLEPFRAITTRWGGAEKINLQNLSKRSGDTTLRRSLRAPKGFVVAACDLSQIEARRMAAHAGQSDLLKLFLSGRDPYSEFGTELYNRPISKDTPKERNVAKEAILSLQYSAWYLSFRTRLTVAYGIHLDEDFAKETVLLYRDRMDRIVNFWEQCQEAIEVMLSKSGKYRFGVDECYEAGPGYIELPDGWRMEYEDIRREGEDEFGRPLITYLDREKRHRRKVHRGIIANNTTQGSSARILMWQINKIRRDGFFMSGTVHDELIFVVPKQDVRDLHDVCTHWMRRGPSWAKGTPMDCEFTLGPSYGDQMELDEWLTITGR